jgi:ABC-2 type transport system permease protein
MHLIRLMRGIIAISVQRELTHRANMAFEALVALVGAAAGLLALSIVFTHTPTLAGWSQGETVVLLGTFQIISGLLAAFVEPNLSWFNGKVYDGQLDEILLKPVPSLFMASLGVCHPWSLVSVGLGISITAAGVAQLEQAPSSARLLLFLLLLLAGTVLAWAARAIVACVAFWAPRFEPDVLYDAFWQLGRYPVSIYHPLIQRLLVTLVPVAFITAIPAQALTRGSDLATLAGALAAAAISIGVAGTVWQAGLRRYTGATA